MGWLWDALRDIWAPEDEFWAAQRDDVFRIQPAPKLTRKGWKTVTRAPSRDEFATWLDDPTTRFVFAALRAAASEQKEAWDQVSWHEGVANQLLLTELRTRADAYESMEASDYEAFCDWAGVDPEPLPGEGTNAA